MASRIVGIEIGTDTLKLAEIRGGKVNKMVVARMPDNLVREGRVTAHTEMIGLLKSLMKENKIRGGICALALPPQIVVSLRVTLPVMSEAELKLNLPFEFRDYVGRDGEEYDYDYIVMNVTDGVMELYASAVRRATMESYYAIFKKAGLTLKMAMPAELAWMNLLTHNKNVPEKLCVVDMGHHTTRVNIYENGVFAMGKDIEYAGQLIDEVIAAETNVAPHVARTHKEANLNKILSSEFLQQPYGAIAIEVMKIVMFYNSTLPEGAQPLKDLYYCGGVAAIEPLRTALVKATNLTPHHVERLLGTQESDSGHALKCGLAAGAAMQKLERKG